MSNGDDRSSNGEPLWLTEIGLSHRKPRTRIDQGLPRDFFSTDSGIREKDAPGYGLITPRQRLKILTDKYGPRTALQEMFSLSLPDTFQQGVIERIVDHFLNGEILLPWEQTPWWTVGPEIVPETPPALSFLQPEPVPWTLLLPHGTPEDEQALLQMADYIKDRRPDLYAKYRGYFEPTLPFGITVPAVLLGAVKAADVWDRSFSFFAELFEAIETLEDWWTGPVGSSWQEPPSYEGSQIAEYFSQYENPGVEKVHRIIARRIWTRRLAVALWSDVNEHWPWSITDLSVALRFALLGWNPEGPIPFYSNDYPEWRNWKMIPWEFLVGYYGVNCSGITGTESKGYGTGSYVWRSDPLHAWHVAYTSILPIVCEYVVQSMKEGLFATNKFLNRRAFLHDDGKPSDQNCPSGCYHPGKVTVRNLLAKNYGGCQYIAPLYSELLCSMNIPCSAALNLPTVGPMHSWRMRTISKGDSQGHSSIVCHLPGGALTLFHADFACAYFGQRYGDPALMWIPTEEWLLVQLLLWSDLQLDQDLAEARALNMLTCHWARMTQVQLKNMKSEAWHVRDVSPECNIWLARVVMAITNKEQNGESGCWIDDYWAGGDAQAVAQKFLYLGLRQYDDDAGDDQPIKVPPGWHSGGKNSADAWKSFNVLPVDWDFTDYAGGQSLSSVSTNLEAQLHVDEIGWWLGLVVASMVWLNGSIGGWLELSENKANWYCH